MKINKRYLAIFIVLIIFFFFIFFTVISRWQKIMDILKTIFYGIVLAYFLTPATKWLEKIFPRTWAIIFLFILLLLAVSIFAILLVPVIIKETLLLTERIPYFTRDLIVFLRRIQANLDSLGLPQSFQQTLEEFIEDIQNRLIESLKNMMDKGVNSAGNILKLFIVPVLSFYFIKDREYFKELMVKMIPARVRSDVLRISLEIHNVLNHFIRAELFIAIIVGIMSCAGFLLIGLQYAFLLGLICGFFEIIPYFGPILGSIPVILISFISGPSKVIWTLVVILVIQQLEGSVISPKIIGDQVGLHPFFVILSLWMGSIFFGLAGMFFAVPAVLILRIILKNIYKSIVSLR